MSLPRINSRTPLHTPDPLPAHKTYPKSSSSSMSFTPQILASLHPRKARYRTTFVGLVFIVFLSTYIFLIHGTALSPSLALHRTDSPAADQLAIASESTENSRVADGSEPVVHNHNSAGISPVSSPKGKGRHRHHPPLHLDQAQELAAVSSFIASLPQNVLPPTVDPSKPIDPQLVLDFDTRGSRASEEVRAMVEDVWARNPVFVYSKLYSPISRELKSILANMHLKPSPTIVDVDLRDDADVLKPMIERLTSSPNLPVLLVGGKSLGSMDDIRDLAKSGELQQLITTAGSVVNGAKGKKKRK